MTAMVGPAQAMTRALLKAWLDMPDLILRGRNFRVPIPRFATGDALNVWLAEQCRKRQADGLRGHCDSIGQRLVRDLEALPVIALQSPVGNR